MYVVGITISLLALLKCQFYIHLYLSVGLINAPRRIFIEMSLYWRATKHHTEIITNCLFTYTYNCISKSGSFKKGDPTKRIGTKSSALRDPSRSVFACNIMSIVHSFFSVKHFFLNIFICLNVVHHQKVPPPRPAITQNTLYQHLRVAD